MTPTRVRPPILAAVTILTLWIPFRAAVASVRPDAVLEVRALVFLVDGISFEELLSVPEMRALARTGGAALMSRQLEGRDLVYAVDLEGPLPGLTEVSLAPPPTGEGRAEALRGIGATVRDTVVASSSEELLVIVACTGPSPQMRTAQDELLPIVMARGRPADLFPSEGPEHTLASDTTRRTGVVTDEDVTPTVLAFLGEPVPSDLVGSPLRVVDAPPPFSLHERHLADRRMWVPVQAAAGIYVTVAGLVAVALLALNRRVPAWLGHAMAWLALSVPSLGVALLAAGHLPTLSYATVVPFVVGVALVATMALVPLRSRGLLLPPAAIGAAVLAYFAVEAALGWTAALTPFLGASELDGGRFYGLPNVFIGLLMGSSLYVAAGLGPWTGFVLVVAVAFFAGLPGVGANLGGAVTLFSAAGLWLGIRSRGRLGWREVGMTAAIVIVGTAAVLAAHRYLTATPTHATRFVEGAGRSLSGLWRTYSDRLLVGWRLIVRDPFALVPVLGVPACLLVVLRPPGPVRVALERHPEWRDVVLVMLLGSVVAYLANDSGAAAVGLGFGMGLGGLLYVSLFEQTWKMGSP